MENVMFRVVIEVVKNDQGEWVANAEATNSIGELTATDKVSHFEAWSYTNKRDLVRVLVHKVMAKIMQ
jgi:hypothetical protein